MTKEEFIEALKELNIEVTEEKLNKLNRYYELLVEWNEKINLTAITEKNDVYLKHFYDSLTLAKIVDLSKISTFADVGTGAGFPGLIIKIFFPDIHITLIDSLNKRTDFLKLVIADLKLGNIEVITGRAEELGHREKYEVVTARAVANLHILLELLVPLSSKYVLLMKGEAKEELENTNNLYKELSIKLIQKIEFQLPKENSKRTLLMYEKTAKTNLKYPRNYGQIKKKPL